MAEFLSAYRLIFGNEVGYANRKNDRGGETMNGITRKNYPDWTGWPVVDAHKPLKNGAKIPELDSLTKQFYKRTQWDAVKGDLIDSQDVATFVCDWFVNSDRHAIKALQRAVGVKADGVIGPKTIEAVNGYHEDDLLAELKDARIKFYHNIVANDASQEENLKGWLNRVERLA